MSSRRWPVERSVLVRVESPLVCHCWSTWRYDPADPWAVQVDFGEGIVWSFARELLARGLRAPAGLGDVQVFPHRGRIAVGLESSEGRRSLLTARRIDLCRFLDLTYRVVPAGEESAYVDLDAAVALLLGEAGRC